MTNDPKFANMVYMWKYLKITFDVHLFCDFVNIKNFTYYNINSSQILKETTVEFHIILESCSLIMSRTFSRSPSNYFCKQLKYFNPRRRFSKMKGPTI